MRKKKRILLILTAAFLLMTAGGFSGCGQKSQNGTNTKGNDSQNPNDAEIPKATDKEPDTDPSKQEGRILWISPDGKDHAGQDGSQSQPYAGLQFALMVAKPGDTIMVRPGIYFENNIQYMRQGEENKWITIKAEEPHKAIIDGKGQGETLRIAGGSYLLIEGLVLQNSGTNLIHADSQSHHLIFRNVRAQHAGPGGDVMKFNQSSDITVEYCDVSYPGQRTGSDGAAMFQELIDFVDVDNAVVRGCLLHHAGNLAIYAKGGSRNALFENNILLGNNLAEKPGDGLLGIGAWTDRGLFVNGDEYETYDMVVRNNIIIGSRGESISVYDSLGARIYNNLIINPGTYSIFFRKGNSPKDETRDVEIFNNIIMHTQGQMVTPICKQAARAVYEVKHGHNIFWNAGQPIPDSEHNWNVPVVSALDEGSNSIDADPKLTDQSIDLSKLEKMTFEQIAAMFFPTTDSPAIGMGKGNTYAPQDFFGNSRPSSNPDVGPINYTKKK